MQLLDHLFAGLAVVFTLCSVASAADMTVKFDGGTVTGIVDSANPAVRQFLGIPYAKSPTGDYDSPHRNRLETLVASRYRSCRPAAIKALGPWGLRTILFPSSTWGV